MAAKYEVIQYVTESGETINAIELLEEYPGIVYSYGDVQLVEVPNETHAMLEFDYDIHAGEYPEDEFQLFRQVIGDILVDIITNGVMPSLEE